MTIASLTAAILADRDRPSTQHNIIPCFVCGHTFVYRGRRDDASGTDRSLNGRFCSIRCQDWFDAGSSALPSADIDYSMKRGSSGFYIDCAHCRMEFESLGLQCSSIECERSLRERQDNLTVMAEAGIEPKAKRQCLQCGTVIPHWRKGRRVSKSVRFCSEKCSKRVRRAAA
jgi:hypothetical protein